MVANNCIYYERSIKNLALLHLNDIVVRFVFGWMTIL